MYMRLSCLRERTIKFRFHSQLSYFQILNSTILITASGFVINSHQGLDLSDYIIGVCSYYIILGQRKVSEERSSLEKLNITDILLTLNELFKYCFVFCFR